MVECEHCNDELWVCEAHDTEAMGHALPSGERCGGAGMPCPVCNEGLDRGIGALFDKVDTVASETPTDVAGIPKVH